jgi:uncharacterized protein
LNTGISQKEANRKMVKKLKRMNNRSLDQLFHSEHKRVFEKIDCLECANCCKTTSPIFKDSDIRRISVHLKMKESLFVESYLKVDEEGDFVLQSSPCNFLEENNQCAIYEVRPQACKGYPHTDRKNVSQILDLNVKNAEICPAVAQIFSNFNRLSS